MRKRKGKRKGKGKSSNYNNEFDGKFKGKALPTGNYYYVFKKNNKIFRGNIAILN
mgnify:CR=1 FL=1